MADGNSTRLRRLRKRAEELLIEGRRDRKVVGLLELIADEAEESSESALFAHRQLAELRLEESPWQAALHLRRITAAGADDDGVYALLGLCHALMSNFRSAVSSYRRALTMAPANPWYHHNLGHLLDVGLDQPKQALFHLREAYRLEPREDEVCASLAHCLGRLGEHPEALKLAMEALIYAPNNDEHRALKAWIESGAHEAHTQPALRPRAGGAPSYGVASPATAPRCPDGKPSGESKLEEGRQPSERGPSDDDEEIDRLLKVHMLDAGFEFNEIEAATVLRADYARARVLTQAKPAVVAAAVEYAMAKILSRPSTQASVAGRYGVSKGAVSSRYRHLVDALRPSAFDPRYVRR